VLTIVGADALVGAVSAVGDVAVGSGAAGAPPQANNNPKVSIMKIRNMSTPMIVPPDEIGIFADKS
jgi:hypothetical protein